MGLAHWLSLLGLSKDTSRHGEDPARAFPFTVSLKIGGKEVGSFTECSGLTMERETEQYSEGGTNNFVHVLPGRTKYTNIVLKRGIVEGNELWDWYQKGIFSGQIEPQSLSIILYSRKKVVLRTWNVEKAYPVKWTGPTMNTSSTDYAVETLELAHHGLTIS